MWWTLATGDPWIVINNILFSPYSVKFSFYVVFQALGAYFNLYFLMPRFLEKGRYVPYILLFLLTVVTTAALIVSGYYAGAAWTHHSFEELYGLKPDNYLQLFKGSTLPSTLAGMTLAMSIRLAKSWIKAQRRQQLLEKEKLETELKFLKSQFNPHFLFNTINSIFVLIHKNPAMASASLAKFSDLLRYQLYECNEQEIPLEQELGYLSNFIELEKLRQDHNNFELTLEVGEPHTGDLTIAPFVLMPFVENAFKHVSQRKDQPNWIRLHLRFEGQRLLFDIANSMSLQQQASGGFLRHSGIGLKNVQRRLDLVYPGKHHLHIQQDGDQFRVTLQLHLHGHTAAEPVTVPA
ncbi:histidine kinase [Chitinophaga japonensis]